MCGNTVRQLWLQIRKETDIGQTLGGLASASEYESGCLELNLWGFRDEMCQWRQACYPKQDLGWALHLLSDSFSKDASPWHASGIILVWGLCLCRRVIVKRCPQASQENQGGWETEKRASQRQLRRLTSCSVVSQQKGAVANVLRLGFQLRISGMGTRSKVLKE